ncbi:thioesterase family protein [Staphylococcus sp. 17KM0847]|uniref:thioesterase family protein n=1 Tax=Staphylococcus sp. 17KM0847 TaxID=2583989 RepID=UPI0015DCA861|nr:thioesterase family protein [Staphylococcus sp. 17KM0847]QLK86711.1 thioesterase [Staphylococcus sp. 17KM0847]
MLQFPFSDQTVVDARWIDRNGHMNDSEYARVFSLAIDHFHDQIGLTTDERIRRHYTVFTLETHISYLKELKKDTAIEVRVYIYDLDHKRTHFFLELINTDQQILCATAEVMMMGINRSTGRSSTYPKDIYQALQHYYTSQDIQQWPQQLGHRINIPK